MAFGLRESDAFSKHLQTYTLLDISRDLGGKHTLKPHVVGQPQPILEAYYLRHGEHL